MITLFQMMTMDSWTSGVMRPVGNVYPAAFLFFLFFACLASLGLLNLLTAIFVESLSALTKKGAIEAREKEKELRTKLLAFIKQTFEKFDEDHSGA